MNVKGSILAPRQHFVLVDVREETERELETRRLHSFTFLRHGASVIVFSVSQDERSRLKCTEWHKICGCITQCNYCAKAASCR